MITETDTILNHTQISHKLTRLAWQVYENNMDEDVIWIAGIQQRGSYIARRLAEELSKISTQKINMIQVDFNDETSEPVYKSEHGMDKISGRVVILVDDVLNTGKTLLKALVPLVESNAGKIQVAVLASRSHRLFPVKADFVGISMATTLHEHLNFDNRNENDLKLTLS